MARRVAVTGLGIVSPIGNDLKNSWQNCVEGRSGGRKITLFDASELPVQIAAEVSGFDLGDLIDGKEKQRMSRFCQFAVSAAHQALTHGDWIAGGPGRAKTPNSDPTRWGTVIGVGLGALDDIQTNSLLLKQSGYRKVSPFFLPYTIPNMAAGIVSKMYNLKGPNLCTTTACSSGTHAIGEGFNLIRNNTCDMVIAGGAEAAISSLGIASFSNMRALSKQNETPELASRPFDRDRDGFLMGEGAGILLLEDWEHAQKRGAFIYAELCGYGLSGDAYHITAPPESGEGAARCMQAALDSAGIRAQQVDYINAHGTSTPLNDRCETTAIKTVFGDYAKKVSISSTKGVTGHCLGAAGGVEAVLTCMAIAEQTIPPTANLRNVDESLDLDYTPLRAKKREIEYALSNSFGFGGTNTSIIFRKSNSQ